MPDLPDVTLCAVDCVNPVLALRALDLSMHQCRFGNALFLSDSAQRYELPGCRMVTISRIGSRHEYSHFVLKELGRYCTTSHMLVIQWDGYVINGSAWRSEFLQYDYIGAPWGWHTDGHRVGNGGFSLRSRRLFEALKDNDITDLDPEDHAIGRRYRDLLETRHGISFAPEDLARSFSFESMVPNGTPFGFHGLFHMWMIMPPHLLPEFVTALAPGTVTGPQMLRLAKNYLELGRKEEAAVVLKRRLQAMPDDAETKRLLDQAVGSGVAAVAAPAPNKLTPGRNDPCPCRSGKRHKECCGSVKDDAAAGGEQALLEQALTEHQAGRLAAAEALYRRVLVANPANAFARQYLGVLAMQQGEPAHGEAMIREAITALPGIPDFHNNLGLCLRNQDRLEEAVAAYRQALGLKPDYTPALNNLGLALQALNRIQEAIGQFEHAVGLQPAFAEAHWNLGQALLTLGELERGWEESEWRLQCHPFAGGSRRPQGAPAWRGESIENKTLLLLHEQGAGDTIQFLRLVPELRRRGARVLLDVRPDLAELAKSVGDGIELLEARNGAAATADYWVHLMSLPHWLGVTLDGLPGRTPYLSVEPARTAAWRQRLAAYPGRKIGLVWGGNPSHKNDRNRSCPLAALRPLLSLPGTTWFSVQKGKPAQQLIAGEMIDLGPELQSFTDTAALFGALDLVIAVDTSVAHLAGALGRPAWVLLPYAPDWRWLLEREDSPWYPSLRLFRQPRPGDWRDVVERVRAALLAAVEPAESTG